MILTIDRGRIKEMVVTAGGLNVAPVPIENRIKKDLSSIIREFCSAKLLYYLSQLNDSVKGIFLTC